MNSGSPVTVVVDRRFRGPSDSGNGGYVAGLVASHVDGPVAATLRIPPPLERPLEIVVEADRATLRDGETVVAEAVAADLDLVVPAPPSLEEARETVSMLGPDDHWFPDCFVCGPLRTEDDGLRILPGRVSPGRVPAGGASTGGGPVGDDDVSVVPRLATTWTPDSSLAGDDGVVCPEFVWGALDCPGGWASLLLQETEEPGSLLGRLVTDVRVPINAGDEVVVSAWPIGRDGRKITTGTALHSADGELLACAVATWIVPRS